ncbi:cytochrome P450 [Streptomyces sp. NPDC000594]|uniref:cytochrome P450 n=1 Tax=Streptomyces sp. NPDC000594 TaxID=3154261 RepID=UPI003334A33B
MSADLSAVPLAPGHLPLLGHTVALLRDPQRFLASLSAPGGLVRLRLGPHRLVLVCDAALTRAVLSDDRVFDKGGPYADRVGEVVGAGLGTCPHRDHRRQRRLCQPAFHPTRLPAYVPAITAAVREVSARWSDGQVIDVKRTMMTMTCRAIARTMFSARLPGGAAHRVPEDVALVVNGLLRRLLTPRALSRVPTPGTLRYHRALARLRRTVAGIVAARRDDPADHQDLLSGLLPAPGPGPADDGTRPLSDREVTDQVITFLLTGTETVAGLLSWTLYELARHPGTQRRLHSDLARVPPVTPPAADGRQDPSPADQVITETLRLHTPIWLLTRTVTADTDLGGTPLPAGTQLAISPYTHHWNPLHHPDPTAFDPGRWADRQPDRTTYLPYGAGPRGCIGDRYTHQTATATLAALLADWEIGPVSERPARAALGGVVVPRRLRLRVTAR